MRVSPDVLSVLARAELDGNALRLTGQLDRKLYKAVDNILQDCGGKWNRAKKAHIFDSDARERIEIVLTTGEVTTAREIGYFPTPQPLAADLVELADVQPDHLALEPSAGDGAIVQALLAAGARVTAVERDARRRQVLADAEDVEVSDVDDFMSYVAPTSGRFRLSRGFHRVVMNPPFCKVGLGDHLDHVRHAYSLLARDGVLVSVLPSSIDFREDRRHRAFRQWVLARGIINPLPEDSFRESGTSVNTCVIRMVKS